MTPEEFMRTYERVTNTHNADKVVQLVTEDAVYWFNDGSFLGIEAIHNALTKTWDTIQNEEYRIEDVRWIAHDDNCAVCIYTFHWRGLIEGQSAQGKGRGTSVLKKINGEWKVAHEHLSAMPKQNG